MKPTQNDYRLLTYYLFGVDLFEVAQTSGSFFIRSILSREIFVFYKTPSPVSSLLSFMTTASLSTDVISFNINN